jgi:V8-like Glu-specific endopeptidase
MNYPAPSGHCRHRSISRGLGICAKIGFLAILPMINGQAAQDTDLRPLSEDSILSGKLGAVGMIVAGDSGAALSLATGFLISPCHVLTAAHVLARPGQHVRLGDPVRFSPSGKNGRAMTQPAWGRVVAADPDFLMSTTAPGFNPPAIARDWGLVELDQPLKDIEPLKLVFPGARIAPLSSFSIVGYPFGARQITLHAQEHCANWSGHHVSVDMGSMVIVDCAVRQGMSGGPLLIEGNATPLAAGIVVERVEFGSKVMTVAVPSTTFGDKVVAAMRESEVCAAGSPFAWPPEAANNPQQPSNRIPDR